MEDNIAFCNGLNVLLTDGKTIEPSKYKMTQLIRVDCALLVCELRVKFVACVDCASVAVKCVHTLRYLCVNSASQVSYVLVKCMLIDV